MTGIRSSKTGKYRDSQLNFRVSESEKELIDRLVAKRQLTRRRSRVSRLDAIMAAVRFALGESEIFDN